MYTCAKTLTLVGKSSLTCINFRPARGCLLADLLYVLALVFQYYISYYRQCYTSEYTTNFAFIMMSVVFVDMLPYSSCDTLSLHKDVKV